MPHPCIGIDGRDLDRPQGTGIATYARGVVQACEQWGWSSVRVSARPAMGGRVGRIMRAALARAGAVSLSAEAEGQVGAPDLFRRAQVYFDLWKQAMVCRARAPIDIMHWTSPLPLRLKGAVNVYTIHDLIPLRQPNRTGTDPVRYRRLVQAVVDTADGLLAVSDASRQEMEDLFPQTRGRVVAIPQAVRLPDAALQADPRAIAADALSVMGVMPGEYDVFTGSIEPRKNLPALIQAWQQASSRKLLVMGPLGWKGAAQIAPYEGLMGPPGSEARIIRLDFTDRLRQLRLIQGARALLFPSLAEGFGLPILEAMALGTPVLTSHGGATQEVAGEAAVLVDPTDPAALRAGMAALEQDAALRARLRTLGLRRVEHFSPDRYVANLGGFYRDLLARHGKEASRG